MMDALQAAIYALLDAAHEVPVFDRVPDKQEPPYVRIGEWTWNDWDGDDFDGREATLTVHHWSSYRGNKEALELMDITKATLHHAAPAFAGGTVVLCFCEFAEVQVDPDGVTRHGVTRFRMFIKETE